MTDQQTSAWRWLDERLRLNGGISSDPKANEYVRKVLDALAAVEKVEKWLTKEVEDGYVRARLSNDGGFVARVWNEYTRDESVAITPTLAELGEKLP